MSASTHLTIPKYVFEVVAVKSIDTRSYSLPVSTKGASSTTGPYALNSLVSLIVNSDPETLPLATFETRTSVERVYFLPGTVSID